MESGVEKKDAAASEDIRTRRKQAKQQKKLEKKTKMQEEFLKDLRKPKDTKVILADKSFLYKLSNRRNESPTAGSFELSSSDFPELSPFGVPRKSKAPVQTPADSADSGKTPAAPDVKKTTVAEDAKPEELCPVAASPTIAVKRTKKKNATVLNLGDLIVNKPPKKKKKRPVPPGLKLRRLLESNTLCGNMLDSSNPKRCRGKHRETEKRTFTKLKLAIIRDRILSLKAKENKSGVCEMDKEKFKLELDLYLSELMKKLKLAKAERAAKVTKVEEMTETIPEVETVEPAKTGKSGKGRKITKYRKYCDNMYSEDLDKTVNSLIQCIVYLQDRAFVRNPIKAKAKPRHVVGLREVKKCLMLHKLKMVIVAPDLEAQDAVFKAIEELKSISYMQNVPLVFALSRRQLGYSSKKVVPVSAFGVISYDGLEEKFAAVKEKLKEAHNLLKASQQADEAPSEGLNIPV